MKIGRNWVWIAVFALIAAGALVVARRHPKLVQRLPDGKILQILAVAYTNQHTLNTRSRVQQRLERWLPSKLDWLLGPPNLGCTIGGADQSLGVWYTLFDPSTNAYVHGSDYQRFTSILTSINLIDEHGCVFHSVGMSSCTVGSSNKWFIGHMTTFPSFPRRNARLSLRFDDINDRTIAEFNLDNPLKGPFPQWHAEILPCARTNGDLE